jgi:hypothetical protein
MCTSKYSNIYPFIECSWRLADVLTCSQKRVSHEISQCCRWRIISIFPFWELWCMLLIDWFNTSIAHIIILSNAHGAWLMFWPVVRRCHILRWDRSVLPLAHHSIFPFENIGACWLLHVSTILWLTHRDCRVFIVRAWCSECVHTLGVKVVELTWSW